MDAWSRSPKASKSARFASLLRAADFTVLVAPETSGVLAGLTRDLQENGARILGSSAEAVDLTGDKIRLAEHLRSQGIDTPHVASRSFRARDCPEPRDTRPFSSRLTGRAR